MTVQDILNAANISADDNFTNDSFLPMIQGAVADTNREVGLIVPIPTDKDLNTPFVITEKILLPPTTDPNYQKIVQFNNQMGAIDDIFALSVITPKCVYYMKQNETDYQGAQLFDMQ
ncbi:MAG: hypothetical protein ACRCXT_08600 [Paraclostridium sp.]